jgi:hypothetical protein
MHVERKITQAEKNVNYVKTGREALEGVYVEEPGLEANWIAPHAAGDLVLRAVCLTYLSNRFPRGSVIKDSIERQLSDPSAPYPDPLSSAAGISDRDQGKG